MNQIRHLPPTSLPSHVAEEIANSIVLHSSPYQMPVPHPASVALTTKRDVDVARYNLAESVMTALVEASPLPIKEISIKEQTGWFFYDKKITFKVKYL